MDDLKNLKVGDEVIVSINKEKKICPIERVTQKFIIVNGIRFSRKYGWATGENVGVIIPATKENIKECWIDKNPLML